MKNSVDFMIRYFLGFIISNLGRISFAFLILLFETVLLFFVIPFSNNLSFQKLIPESKQHYKDFDWSSLEKVYLEGTCLASPVLKQANLRRADLKGAEMQGANLEGTNLEEANLESADLEGANLMGANLKGADITIKQLSEVRTLYKAILDPSIIEQIQRDYPHLLGEPKSDENEDG